MARRVSFPCGIGDLEDLRAGEPVLASGTIYTARDAAHKRLCELISAGGGLPFDLGGQAIYYCGPCPAPPGAVVGSCGPTSAIRMNAYARPLFEKGVAAVIAKGPLGDDELAALREFGATYLCATGGAGALLARSVRSCEVVAFDDLGTESIKRMEIEDMPLLVGIDSMGRSLFERGAEQ